MTGRGRRFGPLVALCLAAALVEASSHLFFSTFRERCRFHSPDQYRLQPSEIQSLRRIYDADLGWSQPFATPFGERPRPVDYGRPLIATFGDSFTYGPHLDDDETFQSYLATLLGADVFNFGVGGFGTDQAYLRFRRDYAKVRTPIAMLGLITGNINRVVNVYRRFCWAPTGVPLTKPRFVLRDGALELLPNPVPSEVDLRNLGDPKFLRRIGENDFWYNRDEYPELAFPYSRILLNKRMWMEAYYGKDVEGVTDIDSRPWEKLWEDPVSRELFLKILDAFVEDAQREGATPVILLMPQWPEVLDELRGRPAENATWIRRHCKDRGYRLFDGIAALAGEVRSKRELDRLYAGHLNAKGNAVIARVLLQFLVEQDLVAAPSGTLHASG